MYNVKNFNSLNIVLNSLKPFLSSHYKLIKDYPLKYRANFIWLYDNTNEIDDGEIMRFTPNLIYNLQHNQILSHQTGRIAYYSTSTLKFTNYSEYEIIKKGFDFFKKFIHTDVLYKTTQTVSILF